VNTATHSLARSLFRDREAALANSAVLLWVMAGWAVSFPCMAAGAIGWNILGVLLCVHTMVLAAYLIHEAAHQTLFAVRWANSWAGETMSFIAGSSYGSFERIRHMHIRHHLDRVDLTCFDFKGLMGRRPLLRRSLQVLEWCYLPATETLMHLQVVWRPLFSRAHRPFLARSMAILALRVALLVVLGAWSLKALVLYFVAAGLLLQVLNFFDAFHHTFEQHFVAPAEPIARGARDRAYEQANTYSNLLSVRHPWLNLLTLNFGYHNAHHERASVPWYKLPTYHRSLYGEHATAVMPVRELLRSWHRHRVRRVVSDDYGVPGPGERRADAFVGAHGVSFLTVI
jgi:fatty acid desaturase